MIVSRKGYNSCSMLMSEYMITRDMMQLLQVLLRIGIEVHTLKLDEA